MARGDVLFLTMRQLFYKEVRPGDLHSGGGAACTQALHQSGKDKNELKEKYPWALSGHKTNLFRQRIPTTFVSSSFALQV